MTFNKFFAPSDCFCILEQKKWFFPLFQSDFLAIWKWLSVPLIKPRNRSFLALTRFFNKNICQKCERSLEWVDSKSSWFRHTLITFPPSSLAGQWAFHDQRMPRRLTHTFHTARINEQIYPALSWSASPLSHFQPSTHQQEAQPAAVPEHVARVPGL